MSTGFPCNIFRFVLSAIVTPVLEHGIRISSFLFLDPRTKSKIVLFIIDVGSGLPACTILLAF